MMKRILTACKWNSKKLQWLMVKLGRDMNQGVAYYKKPLYYNWHYADAMYNLGVAYSEMLQFDKALVFYELAFHFNPHCPEACNSLDVIYKDRYNLDKAVECYQMALSIKPNFSPSLSNLGLVYTIQGKMDAAANMTEKAIVANPTYAEAYNNLGVLCRDAGSIYLAIEAYDRCLKIDPDFRNAGQNRLLPMSYLNEGTDGKLYEAHRMSLLPHLYFFQCKLHSACSRKWGSHFMRSKYTSWDNPKDPERALIQVSVNPFFYQRRMYHTSDSSTIDDRKELFMYPPYDSNECLTEDQIPLDKMKELYGSLILEYESRSRVAIKKKVTWMDFARLFINTVVEKRIWLFEEIHRRNLHIVDGPFTDDPPVAITWELPGERRAIVSVDAGFVSKSGMILYAVVIRNEHGEILLVECITKFLQPEQEYNPHKAEAEAIYEGVRLANAKKVELGYNDFVIESDSKEAIRNMSSWVKINYPNVELRHTYRELMGLTQQLINYVKNLPIPLEPDYEYFKKNVKPIADGFRAGMLRLIFPESRKSRKARKNRMD